MTTKTTKTVLFAVILSAILIPLTIMGSANAADSAGKTVIDIEPKIKTTDDLTQLITDEAFDKAQNDEERQLIKDQAAKLLKSQPIRTQADIEKRAEYLEIQSVLTDAITSMPHTDDEYAVPFTRIGYTDSIGMLEVRIHQDSATRENMLNYEKTIRSIIGNDVDLKISNGGDYFSVATCNNGPLADCSTLESGVEYEVDASPGGPCTIGMRATFDGDNGFVSAGHCVDGTTDDAVYQDEDDGSQTIGTVSKET